MSKSKYREIDVKKQHTMSLREAFALCIKGVKHRLLRSVLTLAVVVLAVAFFMFLLSESMFLRSTGRGVGGEVVHERFSQQMLTRIFAPATDWVAVRRLAAAWKDHDAVRLQEFSDVTGIPRGEIDSLAQRALEERTYIDWLAAVPTGKRTVLIHKTSGRESIHFILSDLEGFHARLAPMIDLRVPGKIAGLDGFLAEYPDYAEKVTALNQAWNAKVSAAGRVMAEFKNGTGVEDSSWIISAPDEVADAWRDGIAKLGFHFDGAELRLMRSQFLAAKECADVYKALNGKEAREAWAKAFRESRPSTTEQKIEQLTDRRAVKILGAQFGEDLLGRVAEKTLYEQRLAKLDRRLAPTMTEEGAFLGLSGRQIFLLAISFMVCMVGISNAMLMSITERFREIATMKCLGATDSYILVQFMMEAAMQGFVGGILGVGIGFVIATLRGLSVFGSHLVLYWPGVDLAVSGLVSLVAGVFLAMLASIQPSWSASRMAPMEAMRVE